MEYEPKPESRPKPPPKRAPRRESRTRQKPVGWSERVSFEGPVAYVPGEVLEFTGAGSAAPTRRSNVDDPIHEVQRLRAQGVLAQLNHVFFSHSSPGFFANPAFANPAFANPAFANPAFANPAFANPAFANPAFANPAFANPAFANPAFANPEDTARETGIRRSSARPPAEEVLAEQQETLQALIGSKATADAPTVYVLDTGLTVDKFSPASVPARIKGEKVDQPDANRNDLLDAAAGHGVFIAGLVAQVAPGCNVDVRQVLSTLGDGTETDVVDAINEIAKKANKKTILNLSFGGYTWDEPFLLARAIRAVQRKGAVVVASAGNDATFVPNYPAALPGVISVGAIGPTGPASFTNYGPWVRACAPGVDLVSLFFRFAGGLKPGVSGVDPDNFEGWARWSGTSFAAPVVAGALIRMIMARNCTAIEAVDRVINAPSLLRIPNLGTVVNVI